MEVKELLTHMNDISEKEIGYRDNKTHALSSFYRYLDERGLKDQNGIYYLPAELLNIKPDNRNPDFFWDGLSGEESHFVIKKGTRFYRDPFSYADFIALRYVYKGQCHEYTPTKEILLEEGDCMMMTGNFIHSQELFENDHIFTMMFDKGYIRDSIFKFTFSGNDISEFLMNYVLDEESTQKYIIFHSKDNIRVRQVFEEILCEQIEPTRYSDEMMTSLLKIFFIQLLYCPYEYSRVKGRNTQRIAGILNYIDQNYQTVTLNQLSEEFGYAPKYISHLFRETIGISFKDYIFSLRFEEICNKLKTTDLPVDEILAQSGISSEAYFYNKFRKTCGMSPGQYRQNYRK